MKTNITISIDADLAARLKREKNYSELINQQMKGFFEVKVEENKQLLQEKLKEIKEILKKTRKKKREIEAQLKKINDKEQKIKEALRQKGLTRANLIKKIRQRRLDEQMDRRIGEGYYARTEYYITPEEEADLILKGGIEKHGM